MKKVQEARTTEGGAFEISYPDIHAHRPIDLRSEAGYVGRTVTFM